MVTWSASTKGYYKGKTETFKGFEFVDQLVAHLPPRRVQLVRRYGAYSGKVRNQWQRRSGIYHLASESWQQAHQLRTQSRPEAKPAAVDSPGVPDDVCRSDTMSRLRRQSWARLLQKVYEVAFYAPQSCFA
jgi:hypothetical protein